MKNIKVTRWVIIPFIIFAILAVFLWQGLQLDPHQRESTLLGKPVPKFELTSLFDRHQSLTNNILKGQVSILHVWATWCSTCLAEHATLLQLAKTTHVPFYGLNYKDNRQKARRYLKIYDNPYRQVMFDEAGSVAIDWGVYGTPESYIIDKQGIIRYKHVGMITPDDWQKELWPLIQKLEYEDE